MSGYSLLICNGDPPARTFARKLAARAERIIAADGGANIARRFGIRPHLIVGDLDSITQGTRRFFQMDSRGGQRKSGPDILHVARQDNTDLEKALDVLVQEKGENVILLAATGGRLDHTLGNLSVLWNYTDKMNITIAGDGWVALPVMKLRRVRVRPGTTVSLIPFGDCSGITLSGLQYPLKNARMRVGEIGVSNVVVKSPCTVSVRRGNMLMLLQAGYFSCTVLV